VTSATRRLVPSKSNPIALVSAIVVGLLVVGLLASGRQFVESLLKGLALGSVYAIIALGFVLIFKATRTINFAQGALAVCGALFVSYLVVDDHIPFTTLHNPLSGLPGPSWLEWILCVLVALVFAALLGLVIERTAIRPMVGKPLFSVAVITLGLEIALRVFALDSSKLGGFRSLAVPWGTDSFEVAGIRLNWSYVAAFVVAGASFVSVYFFYRSRMGVAMRAVSYDQEAAMAQGINVGRVFAIAWGAGAVLAALGGIFATQPPLSQTGAVGQETVFVAFRALPAVILGGLDSVQGALFGGLIIGVAEIMAGQYLAEYSDQLGAGYPVIIPYVVMVVVLLVKPYGMFGTPEVRRV
jgi:branched-chain amino acid transport system permease protein